MDEFTVLTSIFEVFYDNFRNIKGGTCYNSGYIEYLKVRNPSSYYEPYDCFFDCIHSSVNTIKDFDIQGARKQMKIKYFISFFVEIL